MSYHVLKPRIHHVLKAAIHHVLVAPINQSFLRDALINAILVIKRANGSKEIQASVQNKSQ
jgi:hypothetical protein